MSEPKALIREWLDLTAMGPGEGWEDKASPDVVMRLPYAPPGVLAEMRGLDQVRETLSHHWGTKQSFAWRDVAIRATEDPELFVTTARSEVLLASGDPYANAYVIFTRVRGGRIVEHVEYFNPLPIVAMLGG